MSDLVREIEEDFSGVSERNNDIRNYRNNVKSIEAYYGPVDSSQLNKLPQEDAEKCVAKIKESLDIMVSKMYSPLDGEISFFDSCKEDERFAGFLSEDKKTFSRNEKEFKKMYLGETKFKNTVFSALELLNAGTAIYLSDLKEKEESLEGEIINKKIEFAELSKSYNPNELYRRLEKISKYRMELEQSFKGYSENNNILIKSYKEQVKIRFLSSIKKKGINNVSNLIDGIEIINAAFLYVAAQIPKYDSSRSKFNTYMGNVINRGIDNTYMLNKDLLITDPDVNRLNRKLNFLIEQFRSENGRDPRENELIGVENKDFKRYQKKLNAISVDEWVPGSENIKVKDTLEHQNNLDPIDFIFGQQYRALVINSMSVLSDSEKQVIGWNFGLFGERRSLKELGDNYGTLDSKPKKFSRQTILNTRTKGLKKISKKVFGDENPELAKKLFLKQDQKKNEEILECLTDREKYVIGWNQGIYGEVKNMNQISKEYEEVNPEKVSGREAVRQVKSNALEKMRSYIEKTLREHDEKDDFFD